MSQTSVRLYAHRVGSQFELRSEEGRIAKSATAALDKFLPYYSDQINKLIIETDNDEFAFKIDVPKAINHLNIHELARRDALNGSGFRLEEMLVPFVTPQTDLPLYPFQRRGTEFLCAGTRRILADDMGLGKSLQTIAAIGALLRSGEVSSALVVCPKTLVFNWLREFNRWDPGLAVNVLLPRKTTANEIWKTRFGRSHIVITSYDHLRENSEHIPLDVDVLVADEAHRVRNLSSQISRAVAVRRVKFLWLLSGTPVERDADDLASLLAILSPGKFTSKHGQLELSILRRMAEKYILRRSKSDVLKELPPHTRIVETIQLSPQQSRSYQVIRSKKTSNYLEKFSKLRTICDYDPETRSSSKLDRVIELLSDIKSNGERAIVFSFWVEPLDELATRLANLGWQGVFRVSAGFDALKRSTQVESFQQEGVVLLASGKIGAEGLTLTEANHVIFINRWWNPSANDQAIDRVRRIGQTSNTFSYHFVAAGTIEERITELLDEKSKTIDLLIEQLRSDGEL